MELERKLAAFVGETRFEDFPPAPVRLMKDVLLNALGAVLASWKVPGCPEAVALAQSWGGPEEATVLMHRGRLSAASAAFANAFMARALVLDEAMVGGLHVGGSAVPAGLALAEAKGGCSGEEFLAAMVAGFELATRLHLATDYDGFDATGVCVVFGSTATAARVLGLCREGVWNALGHALNRAGGSWQGTIDGSIAARVLQGNAAQGGVMNAQLAQHGITGPVNFLEGVYGYFHLFAGDRYDPDAIGGELGQRFDLARVFLKKHPTCGTTNSAIDAIFSLMDDTGLRHEDIERIDVRVTPFTWNLTGKPFELGDNPRVSAMYSIQYCVANALVRRQCRLRNFDVEAVRAPGLMEVARKVHPVADASWDETHQLACAMTVTMKNGAKYEKHVEHPRGTPENPLKREELLAKFVDCVSYGGDTLSQARVEDLIASIDSLEQMKDMRTLVTLLS